MKTKEELKCIREAQKRLAWIDNVKRVYGWDQETAELKWSKIKDNDKFSQPGIKA